MDNRNAHRNDHRWAAPATLLVALLLTLAPYPQWMKFAQPDWVTLALFYWCLAKPRWVGVGYGWVLGLLLDLTHYTLFGQHAIGKALIALVVVGAHQRLRLYHRWQQCAVVLALACIDIGIVAWGYRLANGVEIRLDYWQAALTTALLWPLVYAVLHGLRHRHERRRGHRSGARR